MQQAADSRIGGSSTGKLAKLTSWLSSKAVRPTAAAAADAPVVLPPFDASAATISAAAEVKIIASALASCGGSVPVPTARASSVARDEATPEPVTSQSHSEAGVEAPASTAEDLAQQSGVLEAAPVEVAAAVEPPVVAAHPAKASVAAGEDDEEDEEEDEDDD